MTALDTRSCLLPYPSNFFTTADATTETGLRVAFPTDGMPANAGGTNVDPSEWNRNDGFSPNSSLLTYVADLDATGSSLPSWTDPAAAASPASPVVMVDTETGELLSLWAEPDAGATDDSERLLVIHPAAPLTEGRHYVVALQGLVDTTGALVEPSATFRALRDRLAGPDWLEARRTTMEETLATLASAGIDRGRLQLAWDFTVASTPKHHRAGHGTSAMRRSPSSATPRPPSPSRPPSRGPTARAPRSPARSPCRVTCRATVVPAPGSSTARMG